VARLKKPRPDFLLDLVTQEQHNGAEQKALVQDSCNETGVHGFIQGIGIDESIDIPRLAWLVE
jgi:hypothetical protein